MSNHLEESETMWNMCIRILLGTTAHLLTIQVNGFALPLDRPCCLYSQG